LIASDLRWVDDAFGDGVLACRDLRPAAGVLPSLPARSLRLLSPFLRQDFLQSSDHDIAEAGFQCMDVQTDLATQKPTEQAGQQGRTER